MAMDVVDYEIFGKDHAPNEKIYRRVCEILGGKPPVNLWYELFLGEDGAKAASDRVARGSPLKRGARRPVSRVLSRTEMQ